MAKMSILQSYNQVQNRWLRSTIINILFLKLLASVYANSAFLNSCEQCASSKEYTVTSETSYFVNVNHSADQSCHWQCMVRVNFAKNSSWLCLAQIGMQSYINDSNGELSIYDSENNAHPFIRLLYYPNSWKNRETCRITQSIDFYLRKMNQIARLDFKQLNINFQVLDIESTDRTVYLDGTYCNTVYKLLNSQVSIYNQPEQDNPITSDHTLSFLCGVPVEMVEVDEFTEKRICLKYLPLDHVNKTNWTFSLSIAGYSTKPADMVYILNSSEERAQQVHAWCADTGIHKVTIIFKRDKKVLKSAEHPKMFKFIIQDYNGTEESLMVDKTKLGLQNLTPDQSLGSTYLIIIIVVSLLCALLIGTAVFLLIGKRFGLLYLPVCKSEDATSV
uniref:Uncharacterized protein n=1 Tax=Arion vulgaris TaxID=1028688 RepID=A0A0B7B7E1_9EUPU